MSINEIEKDITYKVYATTIATIVTILALIGSQTLKLPFEGAQFFIYGFSLITGWFAISFFLSLNKSIEYKEQFQADLNLQQE